MLEKKRWTPPRINFVEFATGDYCVSTCYSPDGYKLYNFICDAGSQFGTIDWPGFGEGGWGGLLWHEANNVEGLQWESTYDENGNYLYGPDRYVQYHACNTTHTTTDNVFSKGWFMPFGKDEDGNMDDSWADENQVVDVMIWNPIDENGSTNWHATNNLSIATMGAKS